MAKATLERLAYEAAIQALQEQERELSELRSRTGALLAAGSVTSSLLGSVALRRGGFGIPSALALLAFLVSTACCIYLLVPKGRVVFSLSGPVLYESLAEVGHDDAELYRRLAFWLERYRIRNGARVRSLNGWFLAASASLAIEMLLWIAALPTAIF